ncbi:hypothetical protein WP12_13860 [Sphingomonas sp. SRS2]|nr:hypothetical protein WP12_13860 [Sphingomonas sp. SRS2]
MHLTYHREKEQNGTDRPAFEVLEKENRLLKEAIGELILRLEGIDEDSVRAVRRARLLLQGISD